ncbi:MAG: hypothetical protein H6741_17090 [Alphaproteobacteria bacterium]|nr:hypothetical protein [Alphaproteobacteria bacterium]MCB9794432.1 hypothetical protein [Alphaproteobacteria bacterium]
MELTLSVARRHAELLRCQYFIAESYNRHYGIMFSEDMHDLAARIEPYPHRYLMATVDGELVGALGLYERETYVERYGAITRADIDAQLEAAGVQETYAQAPLRELTKLVVKAGWERRGLARLLHERSHSPDFIRLGVDGPVLLAVCGKISFLDHMFAPGGRIGSRFMAPFPRYPIHEAYRRDSDPMESRLIIPELDVPEALLATRLPLTLTLEDTEARP